MAKKKKFVQQAKENLANADKSYKALQLQLRRVKKDIEHMINHRHNGPPFSDCPPKKKR
jgi:hypothetical protein